MRNMPKTRVGNVRVDEAAVEAKRIEIRNAMRRLGDRIASGDDSELLYWVIDGALACAHRPLRYHSRYAGSRVRLPAEALALVDEWAVRKRGRSTMGEIRERAIRIVQRVARERNLAGEVFEIDATTRWLVCTWPEPLVRLELAWYRPDAIEPERFEPLFGESTQTSC